MKMKIFKTITDLELSMSFANLFIGLLVQSFHVFSSKGALLHITCHHFVQLKLLYRNFLLITSPNLSSFCRMVSCICCGHLPSPYFYIQICNGFHYPSLRNTWGRFFQFVFPGHNDQFQLVTYGHLFVVLWLTVEVLGCLKLGMFQTLVVLLKLCRALVYLVYIWLDWNTNDFLGFS